MQHTALYAEETINLLLTLSQQPVRSCGFDMCECKSDSLTQTISEIMSTVSEEREGDGENERDTPPQEIVEVVSWIMHYRLIYGQTLNSTETQETPMKIHLVTLFA